jgi:membrane protease YdiL (CAAX protease family)
MSTSPEPSVSRVRWWIYLVLIASYPLIIGLMSGLAVQSATEPVAALSADPGELFSLIGIQLLGFFLLFGVAWAFSRASAEQLLLKWTTGWTPIWRGALYSIGLRLGVGGLAIAAILVGMLFGGIDEQTIEELRPKIEHSIDTEAIEHRPLYLFLNVTLVSFIFAGFREELWRVAVLAGLQVLFPKLFESIKGKLAAIAIVAIIFGLGHLSQGWGGVVITTALGLGLGAVMIFHRSLWDAVFAHGFFNASSFVMIYILLRYFPNYSPF